MFCDMERTVVAGHWWPLLALRSSLCTWTLTLLFVDPTIQLEENVDGVGVWSVRPVLVLMGRFIMLVTTWTVVAAWLATVVKRPGFAAKRFAGLGRRVTCGTGSSPFTDTTWEPAVAQNCRFTRSLLQSLGQEMRVGRMIATGTSNRKHNGDQRLHRLVMLLVCGRTRSTRTMVTCTATGCVKVALGRMIQVDAQMTDAPQ